MKQNAYRLSTGLIIVCLMILCLLPPSFSLAAGQNRYVLTENGKSLNVRDLPGKKGSVISRLANGSKVSVLSDEGDWVQIEQDGCIGYVMAKFLTDAKPASPNVKWTKSSKTMYVATGNKGRLHLRKDASRKSSSLGLFANGTAVQVSALSDAWAKVTVSGKNGYMMLSCLTDQKVRTSSGKYIKGTGSVRMYAEAGTDSSVLMVLPGRTAVKLYSEDGTWARITAHGQIGYVKTASLTDEEPAVGKAKATIINPNGASYVNLRSSAALVGPDNVLAHIKVNTSVEVLNRNKSWVMINAGGMVGYVHRTFLSYD